MSWVEVFIVLAVSHLVGDFLLQTEWQAQHKIGGLTSGATVARRALFAHILTYTLCFVPALVWLSESLGWGVLWVAALIALPHLIQDDGRLLSSYLRSVKRTPVEPGGLVYVAVDQSFHLVTLFLIALAAGS